MLKYLTNNSGSKTAVVVPFKEWEKLNNNYSKLMKKVEILTGIKQGFAEIKHAKKEGKKLQSLNDFLNENRD